MELNEGTQERAGRERRQVVITFRLKPSTVDAIDALAKKEDRKRADMLRLLLQDGYRARTGT
jgi:predicted transcriptional regulator